MRRSFRRWQFFSPCSRSTSWATGSATRSTRRSSGDNGPAAAVTLVVAQCRAGFEPEAAADLVRVATQAQCTLDVDAPPGRGYVLARCDALDRKRWSRAEAAWPPIFIR